jgi:hypothetical protein
MQEETRGTKFWAGNAVLGVALLTLLYIGPLWERFGVIAMAVWAMMAGLGAYLLMSKEDPKDPQ